MVRRRSSPVVWLQAPRGRVVSANLVIHTWALHFGFPKLLPGLLTQELVEAFLEPASHSVADGSLPAHDDLDAPTPRHALGSTVQEGTARERKVRSFLYYSSSCIPKVRVVRLLPPGTLSAAILQRLRFVFMFMFVRFTG